MDFLKRHAGVLGVAVVAGIAVFFAYQGYRTAYNAEEALIEARASFKEHFFQLDSMMDRMEREILVLRSDGYVEADTFPSFSEHILDGTVIVLREGEAIGSGFFIGMNGVIATAAHVADAAGDFPDIKMHDGTVMHARIAAKDEAADIALLKVEGNDLPALVLGYFENAEVGEEVGIAGFNKGLSDILIHRGVISLKTEAGGIKRLGINAFINKGNSGGPIFSSLTGRVVGIISSRQTDVQTEKLISLPEGYSSGFAIGGIDPVKLNVELYNETVKTVGDVSQVGIGFGIAVDYIYPLMRP